MAYWITHSGTRIDINNISENDINLSDIAHHLTKICRYGGSLPLDVHYSVAQHSIELVFYAQAIGYDSNVQRALLMHDATEAYLGDVNGVLKHHLPDYKEIEADVGRIIFNKYDIHVNKTINDIVEHLDKDILLDEALTFMPEFYQDFSSQLNGRPLGIDILMNPSMNLIHETFLYMCNQLNIKD